MGAPTPDVIVEPFGSGAGGGFITLPIPVPSQLPANPGFASFTDGFPSDTMGAGSLPPRGQDFNGILYMLSAYCQALTGGQFWSFNSTWEAANSGYAAGAILSMAANDGLWINESAGNANNPDTTAAASSNWAPLAAYGWANITGLTNANVTLTAPQAALPIISLNGALTGNIQIIFPPWLKQWLIQNNTTGQFSVTCKTASGTGVAVPQGGVASPTLIYGDGTNIQPVSAVGQPIGAHKAADTARASTTTLANDPDLVVFIPAAGTYVFEILLLFTQGAVSAGGIQIGVPVFTGTFGFGRMTYTQSINGTDSVQPAISSANGGFWVQAATILDSGIYDFVSARGLLNVTTPGVYSIQWAQQSSSATATTMHQGSYIRLTAQP